MVYIHLSGNFLFCISLPLLSLQQENEILSYEKEQLEMTIQELTKCNALIDEDLRNTRTDLTKTKEKLKRELSIRAIQSTDGATDKDKLIKSLQTQVTRLQQQLAVGFWFILHVCLSTSLMAILSVCTLAMSNIASVSQMRPVKCWLCQALLKDI